jgi:Ca-activated chloride channel family protein
MSTRQVAPASEKRAAPSGRVVTETEAVQQSSARIPEEPASNALPAEGQYARSVEAENRALEQLPPEKPVGKRELDEATKQKLSALGYATGTEQEAQEAYEKVVERRRSELQTRLRALPAQPGVSANLSIDERPKSQQIPTSPRRSDVAQRQISEVFVDSADEDVTSVAETPVPEGRVVAPVPAPIPEAPGPSTGGTHEPNDAPYGDMFFKSYGTNPFVDTEVDTQSTFGLDVDTGSYTLARSYIERGNLPPGEAIRVEEFVNYFDYGDPAPRRGDFTITAEGAPSPFTTGPRYYLVRFGIKGREISAAERKPAMLIFVVDVSGSMRRENRLGLVKRSLQLLLGQLRPQDQVGLVVYGSRGQVLLEPTGDRYAIERAIERLVPNGSTNAEEGLTLAYDLARTFRRRGAINRIILCSDGVANVGRTGPDSILERIQSGVDQGIELTTVGFGMGNYNDVLMEQLADKGDGSYAYVDTLDEARRIFVENLTGTLQTIASDAKVQVEFDPATVSLYRLLGYENRDIADHRFRDDTVDAGEIGAGHEVTALYEIKLQENVAKRDRLATLRLRYRSKETGQIVETAVDLSQRNFAKRWESATPALRLSSVVAEFAEILRGSHWAKEGTLDMLERRVTDLAAEHRRDPEVQDFLTLVEQARRIAPHSVAYGEDE